MKNETTKTEHIPGFEEEDKKAAAKHREEYELVRDLKAKENNESIKRRLSKNKEKQG